MLFMSQNLKCSAIFSTWKKNQKMCSKLLNVKSLKQYFWIISLYQTYKKYAMIPSEFLYDKLTISYDDFSEDTKIF